MRRAKRWMALYRVVHLIAPVGVLHFWWMVKKDVTEPAVYAAVLAVLLGYRLAAGLAERRRVQRTRPISPHVTGASPQGT